MHLRPGDFDVNARKSDEWATGASSMRPLCFTQTAQAGHRAHWALHGFAAPAPCMVS